MSRFKRSQRRRAAADKERGRNSVPFVATEEEVPTALHEERLDAVMHALRESGAATVLDLGCGSGALLQKLAADPRFTRIVGIDTSLPALHRAEQSLPVDARLSLRHGSFTEPDVRLAGFGAAAMVEALEHVAPGHLSQVEKAVFAVLRPRVVVLTTPNQDYNAVLGLADGEVRHHGHRFEWGRARFRSWAQGVADRNAYRVRFQDVGAADPLRGAATQMAVFEAASHAGAA
ncbi:MAG: class I SAM-dependent methyltransferase [Thioalkalivibrio sp.]|nr:class I SAM-dependent methyltransferase [Thioalkalivibrio sp.]